MLLKLAQLLGVKGLAKVTCPHCGKEVAGNIPVCDKCGKALGAENPAEIQRGEVKEPTLFGTFTLEILRLGPRKKKEEGEEQEQEGEGKKKEEGGWDEGESPYSWSFEVWSDGFSPIAGQPWPFPEKRRPYVDVGVFDPRRGWKYHGIEVGFVAYYGVYALIGHEWFAIGTDGKGNLVLYDIPSSGAEPRVARERQDESGLADLVYVGEGEILTLTPQDRRIFVGGKCAQLGGKKIEVMWGIRFVQAEKEQDEPKPEEPDLAPAA